MSSCLQPKIANYKAAAALAAYKAVKKGADDEHVVVGAANTDRCIGIVQNSSTAAEDILEVAHPGGGAKALLGEAVNMGDFLVSHTDGTLVLPNAEGDVIIAQALEDGASGDVIGVNVILMTAHAAI